MGSLRQAFSSGIVESVEDFAVYVDKIVESGVVFGFDIETGYEGVDKESASLHPEEGFIVGFSFSPDESWARYVSLRHDDADQNLDPAEIAPHLWRLLRTGKMLCHNVLFEIGFLSEFFHQYLPDDEEVKDLDGVPPFYADTMLMAQATARFEKVGLKELTKELFLAEQATLESLLPDLKKTKMKFFRFNPLPLSPDVISYACDDAAWCLSVFHVLKKEVDLSSYVVLLAHKTVPILHQMAHRPGLLYDWEKMQEYLNVTEKFLVVQQTAIQQKILDRTGDPLAAAVNFNSPAQVSKLFYETLQLPEIRDHKTKKLTTNAKALESLAKHDDIVQAILEYKEVKKLIGSYLAKYLKEFRYDPSGFTHPSHNQVRVNSGRLAVSSPGYQQPPSNKKYVCGDNNLAVEWRSLIIAPEDHYILGFDYGQQEYRVLAGMSGDPALLESFAQGVDIHKATASQIFDTPISDISEFQRDVGKTIGFALIFGQGIEATATKLGVSVQEAEEFIDNYFSAFTEVRPWMDEAVQEGYDKGHIVTYFGRKVPIFELRSGIPSVIAKGERLCVNAKCQGTGADVTLTAQVRIHSYLKKQGLDDRVSLVMNIHDALYLYVHKSLNPYEITKQLQPLVEIAVPNFPRFLSEWFYGANCSKGALIDIPDSLSSTYVVPQMDSYDDLYAADLAKKDEGKENQPRKMTVVLSAMPQRQQLQAFTQRAKELPGSDSLVFVTPAGVKASSLLIDASVLGNFQQVSEILPSCSDVIVE